MHEFYFIISTTAHLFVSAGANNRVTPDPPGDQCVGSHCDGQRNEVLGEESGQGEPPPELEGGLGVQGLAAREASEGEHLNHLKHETCH